VDREGVAMAALEQFLLATVTALMLAGTLILSDQDNPLTVALKRDQPVQYFLQSCGP
jgi:hypothetical protein